MGWPQTIIGFCLVLLLTGLSIGFARLQIRNLRRLRLSPELPEQEQQFERAQAWRRLVGCALTLLLGLLLAGALLFLEAPAQQLADAREQAPPQLGVLDDPQLTAEDRDFIRFYTLYWIVLLLSLLLLLGVAARDLLATRSYAQRQHRQIQTDRRAMIQKEIKRLREQRNGHGP